MKRVKIVERARHLSQTWLASAPQMSSASGAQSILLLSGTWRLHDESEEIKSSSFIFGRCAMGSSRNWPKNPKAVASLKIGEATIEALRLRKLDPSARIAGHGPRWAAPVGVYSAANGFGEEHWVDAVPETTIAISLSGAPVTCCWGPREGMSGFGWSATGLQPKGTRNHFRASGAIRFAHIYLPDQIIDRVAEGLGSSKPYSNRLREDFIFQLDPRFEELVRAYVERICSEAEPASTVEIEARATLLVEYILRQLHGLAPTISTRERGGLASWQVRRTTEYLQDNLARDVALSELAALAKLSPFHFSRAFKASLGRPPYAYLRELRLARARAMLIETSLPVTEIAGSVGYEAPQALGKAFRREFGVTPTEYRKRGCD